MGAYILRRLLLVIPTLLGIMIINFTIVQFAPGGPVEQVLAQSSGFSMSATAAVSSGSLGPSGDTGYTGSSGLDPELVADLKTWQQELHSSTQTLAEQQGSIRQQTELLSQLVSKEASLSSGCISIVT